MNEQGPSDALVLFIEAHSKGRLVTDQTIVGRIRERSLKDRAITWALEGALITTAKAFETGKMATEGIQAIVGKVLDSGKGSQRLKR